MKQSWWCWFYGNLCSYLHKAPSTEMEQELSGVFSKMTSTQPENTAQNSEAHPFFT